VVVAISSKVTATEVVVAEVVVSAVPVEQELGGLGVAPGAGCAHSVGKGASLDEGTMLVGDGEEGHAVDLLPEI
jgi:hypothetical protein